MPLLDDDTMTTFTVDGSGYQFSGVDINNHLKASEYTLVGITCDKSTSVASFAKNLETCIQSSVSSCQSSPRVDNLLARLTTFNRDIEEVHGFRHLTDCPLSTYENFLQAGGTTSLYDASVDMIGSLASYGKQLQDQDYTANGIVFIITDGEDVGSTHKVNAVKEAIAKARRSEALESIITVLIGVNVQDPHIAQFLAKFKDEAGIDQYIEAPDASPKTLAKITGFISKSVSSQSQAVRTGSASQLITF